MNDSEVIQAARIIDRVTSIDDLLAFQSYITNRIHALEAQLGMSFKVGDKVTWTGKRNRRLTGIVATLTTGKRSMMRIETEMDGVWRVSPSLVKKVEVK